MKCKNCGYEIVRINGIWYHKDILNIYDNPEPDDINYKKIYIVKGLFKMIEIAFNSKKSAEQFISKQKHPDYYEIEEIELRED